MSFLKRLFGAKPDPECEIEFHFTSGKDAYVSDEPEPSRPPPPLEVALADKNYAIEHGSCAALMASGKREGERCGAKLDGYWTTYCGRHWLGHRDRDDVWREYHASQLKAWLKDTVELPDAAEVVFTGRMKGRAALERELVARGHTVSKIVTERTTCLVAYYHDELKTGESRGGLSVTKAILQGVPIVPVTAVEEGAP